MKYYQIGEMADKLNISRDTIRYYEKINLISHDLKEDNSYHYYSENTLLTLKLILEIKKCGFTLKEIKAMISSVRKGLEKEEIDSVILLLQEKLVYLDETIRKMNGLKAVIGTLIETVRTESLKDCAKTECGINDVGEILRLIEENAAR